MTVYVSVCSRQMSEADGAGSSAGASEQIQRIQQEYVSSQGEEGGGANKRA